jgi:hypothetical protein
MMTSAMMETSARSTVSVRSLPLVADMGIEDNSPFGLQGLRRETMTLLKTTAVKSFAATLALSGPRQQMKDPVVAEKLLARNPQWVDEYRVIHLIERSLWFEGRNDFVMQMTRNPSQIPDNPPAEIREALAKAYSLHPEATVWYGVPLFGEEKNADGLPVPLTASQLRDEAERRFNAAQDHALSMGWVYRSLLRVRRMPERIRQSIRRKWMALKGVWHRFVTDYRQARKDAQRRGRAAARAQFEYVRTGKSTTVIPEHSTQIGKIAARAAASLFRMESAVDRTSLMTEEFLERHQFAVAGFAVLPMMALQVLPLFLAPATVVACDPFLFIELPDEPGKLRMIGHWYWQPQANGRETLHVHV